LTKLKFEMSAGIKDILGKELITQQNTAIFELVKNSYDAKATSVEIVFENIKDKNKKNISRLLIIDNGIGMSYNDIDKKWRVAGYSEKKITVDEEEAIKDFRDKIARNERVFTGAKGIGRFSADRLGKLLTLYTKEENKKTIHCLKIDWEKFNDQKDQFQEIEAIDYSNPEKIPISHTAVENFKKGTILEISPLEDDWDRKNLAKLRNFLQRLLNPEKTSGEGFKIAIEAEEFLDEDKETIATEKKMAKEHTEEFLSDSKEYKKIIKKMREVVNGEIKNVVFEKLKINATQIICEVQAEKITTEIIDKGIFVFRVEEENTFKPLSEIDIHIFYLNRAAKTAFTKIMGMRPYEYGSIFLYKNGFRIQPFGDPQDDWLDLEARKGQGFGRNLSRREAIGRIDVTGPQLGFQEVTSRDRGVVHSKEFRLLLELIREKVLRWLTRYVVEGIDWDREEEKKKKTDEEIARDSVELISKIVGKIKDSPHKKITFNPDLLNIFKSREIDKFSKLAESVRTIISSIKSPKEKKQLEEKLAEMERYEKKMTAGMKSYQDEIKIKEKEILFLKKSLAPDRVIIEDYHHTIRIATGYIETYVKHLIKKILQKRPAMEIMSLIENISRENQKIKSLVSLVSKANFNLKTKDVRKDVIEFTKQYLQVILSESYKRVRYRFQNDRLRFVTRFKPLEISMIFDNFVSNSRKAGASLIKIRFEAKNKELHIYIGDNGKGISKNNEKHIFTRGFTTTEGSGIGLSHIKSITGNMGGDVKFIGNNFENLGKGACFEVIFR